VPTIEARATGRRRALLPRWQLPLPPREPGDAGLTLRELIARVVREEVAAYQERRRDARLVSVLSERDIEAGVAAGRVHSGGAPPPRRVDPDQAVGVALQAFEDGLYLVVIDGRQHLDLDEQVLLGEDSTVTFLRLVALSGG
jgi:hypothetical protein